MIKKQQYSFVTTFSITAPIQSVWETLMDFEGWETWWKGVHHIHATKEIITLSIGYAFYTLQLRFVLDETVLNKKFSFFAHGDLEGTGRFEIEPREESTQISFYWDVQTQKPLMNILAPVLRPFFIFSHNIIMHAFVRGMAKKLKAKVLVAEYK